MDRKKLLNYYYALRDAAAIHTGYSRLELHMLAKQVCFPLMFDDEENFMLEKFSMDQIMTSEYTRFSLTMLSDKGLDVFVEAFKVICKDYYNFVL